MNEIPMGLKHDVCGVNYSFKYTVFNGFKTAILKSGPLLQSLARTLIKHTWAC